MKRVVLMATLVLASLSFVIRPAQLWAYNFGDFRSETLVTKAWEALANDDIEAVLAYTSKCIELYAEQAKKMQDSMTDYAQGSNDEVFSYWALNDIATSYFIQGEVYRKAGMLEEAAEAYKKIVNEYSYGQTWDPKGWFWKPAEAAKEKMAMIESGSDLDFGDYTSVTLTTKAWEALNKKDLEAVLAYANKCIELYSDKAKEMQSSLIEYPYETKEKIFSFWALNDVGTCFYIKGEAYQNSGDTAKAREAFQKLVDEYFYAQCWDPKGWFWKPAEAAQQKLEELSDV